MAYREKILVAEDEPDVREMCLRILKRGGYTASGVENGHQAVALAHEERFDLLLTDIKMPGMGGLEAFQAISAFNPDIVAVVMTGFGTLDFAIEALRLGVSEFVLKPFRPDELNAAVTRALTKQRLERENARLKALIPLFDLSRVFMSSVDLATIPQHVVRIAREALRADVASLMLLNERDELVVHASEGVAVETSAKICVKYGQGIAGAAAAQRQSIVANQHTETAELLGTFGVESAGSAVSVPLIHKDQVLGTLNIARVYEAPSFSDGDVEFLSLLASQAAIALDNARLFREIQEAYQRLSELDHLKGEFISIASHELRSPLAVVLAYATLLEEEAIGPMREHLGQVVQAAMQLKSIIDEMVSLRHIDTGEAQVHIAPVETAPVDGEGLYDLRLLSARKNQKIELDLEDLPLVLADRQVYHLILSNLISNAIKFTPDEGRIRIAGQVDGGQIVIAISDTGVGIPEDELGRIFERFYQVEDSLRRQHGGIGLGLAIAREMAELIGGRIWAVSKVDCGSTFYLSLPQAS